MKKFVALLLILGAVSANRLSAQTACGAMTIEDAASLLGIPAQELQYEFSEEMHTCSFRKGFRHSIRFALYHEQDPAGAKRAIDQVAAGLSILVECEPIDGVGDFAISCHGERAKRLLVQKGARWVDVLSPMDPEQKIKVAEKVLEF